MSVDDHRSRLVPNIEEVHELALANIQRAQQRMKDYYDRNASPSTYVVGSKVWVYTPKTRKGSSKKLLHNWHGPYRIVIFTYLTQVPQTIPPMTLPCSPTLPPPLLDQSVSGH